MSSPLNAGDIAPLTEEVINYPAGIEVMRTAEGEMLTEAVTKRHREILLTNVKDYIKAHEEVTLVIYLNGGLPINVELIQLLQADPDGFDMSKLHIAYVDGKTETAKLIGEIVGTPLYIDDIADTLDSSKAVNKLLGNRKALTFVPIVKNMTSLKLASKSKLEIGSVNAMLANGEELPDVMYVEAIEDSWAVSAYGMDGGHLLKLFTDHDITPSRDEIHTIALIDSLERLCSICLKGIPEGMPATLSMYVNFLRTHSAINNVDKSPLANTLRLMKFYALIGDRNNKATIADDLIKQIMSGEISVDFN